MQMLGYKTETQAHTLTTKGLEGVFVFDPTRVVSKKTNKAINPKIISKLLFLLSIFWKMSRWIQNHVPKWKSIFPMSGSPHEHGVLPKVRRTLVASHMRDSSLWCFCAPLTCLQKKKWFATHQLDVWWWFWELFACVAEQTQHSILFKITINVWILSNFVKNDAKALVIVCEGKNQAKLLQLK